jgi:DNA mismatch repair protein MutL
MPTAWPRIRERSPEVHLYIEIPADRVDVNVHPTKAEVRFREQSLVHELVRRAVGDALGRGASRSCSCIPRISSRTAR